MCNCASAMRKDRIKFSYQILKMSRRRYIASGALRKIVTINLCNNEGKGYIFERQGHV